MSKTTATKPIDHVDESTKPSCDLSSSSKPSDASSEAKDFSAIFHSILEDSIMESQGPAMQGGVPPEIRENKINESIMESQGSAMQGGISPKIKESEINEIFGKKVVPASPVDVKMRGDVYSPWITGCTFMPSGHLVLCDHNNNEIKLLSQSLEVVNSLSISYPSDVSVVDDNNVLVSFPGKEQCQYVQVFPTLKEGRPLPINKKCWGVKANADKIYVTCHTYSQADGEVRIYGYDGAVKARYGLNRNGSMFSRPNGISVNISGTKIYVSDFSTHTITCLKNDGAVTYQHKNSILKGPRKLYLDSRDNVIVCGRDSSNVIAITADGRKNKELLTAQDGIEKPCSIAFRPQDGTLVISCENKADILVYKLV